MTILRDVESAVERWSHAGVIDFATAERIRVFERGKEQTSRLNWPVLLAVAFGAVMLAAGLLLFVAAHWDELSPAWRFSLVLFLVAAFHLGGAFVHQRWPRMATALHAVGTAVLGAGIFLTGQIFHLEEHWPGGVMLWALGAWIGWFLLRDWVQAGLAAVLTPAWLAGEWMVADNPYWSDRVLTAGLLLLAIVYFTAETATRTSPYRKVLKWIGGLALFPCAIAVGEGGWHPATSGHVLSQLLAWLLAIGPPLAVAVVLRGRQAWCSLLAAGWVIVLSFLPNPWSWSRYEAESLLQFAWRALGPFVWHSVGALGMVAWGLYEQRKERVNIGIAAFAISVLAFYFSSVMDKLGRSTSFIQLGIIFLLGGWYLERTRRRLVARVAGAGR